VVSGDQWRTAGQYVKKYIRLAKASPTEYRVSVSLSAPYTTAAAACIILANSPSAIIAEDVQLTDTTTYQQMGSQS
jgi:hypothetical protein